MTEPGARVVAITGASSGIGRATALHFARRGWRVGLIARGEENLHATRREVAETGAAVSVAIADVADSGQVEAAAEHVEAELGPIDVWVNNAGVSTYGKFMDLPEEEFRRVTDVNYLGVVNGTRTALRRMLPRDKGVVVQVLSAIAYRGVPLQSAYSGSKYALRGFTEAVRSELASDNSRVRLTTVFPPSVNTPFYDHAASHMPKPVRPVPPVYQPELVAEAIHLAATSRRRDVNVGGQTVAIALGNALAPGLVDLLAGLTGPASQQSDRDGAGRDPNLFAAGKLPSPARGAFNGESLSTSAQMWAEKNRGVVGLGLGLIALAALSALAGAPRLERGAAASRAAASGAASGALRLAAAAATRRR